MTRQVNLMIRTNIFGKWPLEVILIDFRRYDDKDKDSTSWWWWRKKCLENDVFHDGQADDDDENNVLELTTPSQITRMDFRLYDYNDKDKSTWWWRWRKCFGKWPLGLNSDFLGTEKCTAVVVTRPGLAAATIRKRMIINSRILCWDDVIPKTMKDDDNHVILEFSVGKM